MRLQKLLDKALTSPQSVRFDEIVRLLEGFGFRVVRISGSHHIYIHAELRELVNVQEVGGMAKPYQVRQFLKLVKRYNLTMRGE